MLTISTTLPLYWHSDCGFSSCSRSKVCCSVAGQACASPAYADTLSHIKPATPAARRVPERQAKDFMAGFMVVLSVVSTISSQITPSGIYLYQIVCVAEVSLHAVARERGGHAAMQRQAAAWQTDGGRTFGAVRNAPDKWRHSPTGRGTVACARVFSVRGNGSGPGHRAPSVIAARPMPAGGPGGTAPGHPDRPPRR